MGKPQWSWVGQLQTYLPMRLQDELIEKQTFYNNLPPLPQKSGEGFTRRGRGRAKSPSPLSQHLSPVYNHCLALSYDILSGSHFLNRRGRQAEETQPCFANIFAEEERRVLPGSLPGFPSISVEAELRAAPLKWLAVDPNAPLLLAIRFPKG